MTVLEDFRSYIKYFTKMNQYDFYLSYPNISELPKIPDLEKATRLFARNISIPSTSLNIQVERVLTEKRVTQINIDYDNVVITFFDTKKGFFHKFFNIWVQSKYNNKGGISYYPSEFEGSANIKLNDNHIYEIKGLVPIQISELRMDDSSVNEFVTFTVSFFVEKMIPVSKDF